MIDRRKLSRLGIAIEGTSKDGGLMLLYSRETDPFILQDIRHSDPDAQLREVDLSTLQEAMNRDRDLDLFPDILALGDVKKGLSDIEEAARLAINATSEIDAPIVRLLDALLTTAIARGASDLHFDKNEKAFEVKIRVDGVLTLLTSIDIRLARMLTARLKMLSNLDITERRRPQDGHIGMTYDGSPVDIRIASLPADNGERIVLRFFRHVGGQRTLQQTGLATEHIEAITRLVSHQAGMLLVCGPTGSGKTTTVYAILETLCNRGLNIMTIEDPVEVELAGVVQSQVNEAIGYDFASGLRAILRHDPDVILVGEIRDQETATTAIRAALTGHLVISTTHANSPTGAIMRLTNLGVDKALMSDALLGVLNQRLLRRYCDECRTNSLHNDNHFSDLPAELEGCNHCNRTGFGGRLAIMERMVMNRDNQTALLNNLASFRIEGALLNEAQKLYNMGLIPKSEVMRVAGKDKE